ncbi:MAG TPA: phosphate ABC transporter substrate-binding protein [Leptolyngbyaceae cyanobacterium M33_DOE_097]|uniref:Phosphate ABC transporter substrate-binding protein n=1 Tax=Oscillatoriales cyanobacterium SpSt-418 TaxID=2282169 RepID=A0A7C3PMC4_9CYAN|nr:phosphate ABC transporter substrate-binding protein [Leptolyngbyaceae cyanobacterium M33_DOE_097]
MAQRKNDTATLLIAFLLTSGLVAGGLWLVVKNFFPRLSGSIFSSTQPDSNQPSPIPTGVQAFKLETTQPNPAVLAIDGSVTLVALVKQFQYAYTQVNPSLRTSYGLPDGKPNGTNAGIRNLIDGKVNMAVSSRPLKPEEYEAGLQSIPIAKDAVAIAVGRDNPYKGGLTSQQLKQIFQGQITNWSEVGGPNLPIKVINRSPNSGSYTLFQEVALLGQPFAPDGANFITVKQDETTPLLRMLGRNGITYSTIQQLEKQLSVRVLPIDGVQPTDQTAIRNGTYPISRVVYLAVPTQTSPAAKQFIDMVLTPQGQQIVKRVGFVPL